MDEVKRFGFYLFNKWNRDESIYLFGKDLGVHIWDKWLERNDRLYWFMNLDNECKQKLVDRANEIYKDE